MSNVLPMNPWSLGALIIGLAGLICFIVVLIDAFEDDFMRGLICLIFPPYAWWYGCAEFDHEKKWLIVVTMIAAPFISSALFQSGVYFEMNKLEKQKSALSNPLPKFDPPIRLILCADA